MTDYFRELTFTITAILDVHDSGDRWINQTSKTQIKSLNITGTSRFQKWEFNCISYVVIEGLSDI